MKAFLFLLLVSSAFCDLSYTVSKTDVAFFGAEHSDELPAGVWVDQKNGWRYVVASVGGDSDRNGECIESSEFNLVDGVFIPNTYSAFVYTEEADGSPLSCYRYSTPSSEGDVVAASNILLIKVDEATNKVKWFTIFGGPDDDFAMGITGDAAGNVVIAGTTKSSWDSESDDASSFEPQPLTDEPRETRFGFLAKFKSDGSLLKVHNTFDEETDGFAVAFNAIAYRTKDNTFWVTGSDGVYNDLYIAAYSGDLVYVTSKSFGNQVQGGMGSTEGQSIAFFDESTIIVGGSTTDPAPPTSRTTFEDPADNLAFLATPVIVSYSVDDSDAQNYEITADWSDVITNFPFTDPSFVFASVNSIAFDVKRGFIYLAINNFQEEAASYLVKYHKEVKEDQADQVELVELDGSSDAQIAITVAQGNFYFPVLVSAIRGGGDFATATRSLFVLNHGYTGPATLMAVDSLGGNPDADTTTTYRGLNYLAYYMPKQPTDNSKTIIVHIGAAISPSSVPVYTGAKWMSTQTDSSFEAGDWSVSITRSAPVFDTLDELVATTGTEVFVNQYVSQIVIPVKDSPENSFTYFLLRKAGKAWAKGTIYVLTEKFEGNPETLSAATPGYFASTTTKNNKIWLFSDTVKFVADTPYYIYLTTAISVTLDIEQVTTISRDVERVHGVYDAEEESWTDSTDSLVFRLVATDDGEGMGDPLFIGFNNQKFEFDGHVSGIYNLYNDPWMNLNTEFGVGNTHDEKITVMKVLSLTVGGHKITMDRDHGKISAYKFIVNIDGEDVTINSAVKHLEGCIDIQYRDMILITSPEHTVFIYPMFGHNRHINTGFFDIHIHHPEEDLTKIGGILGQTAQIDAEISVEEATFEVKDMWSYEKSRFFENKPFDECTDN